MIHFSKRLQGKDVLGLVGSRQGSIYAATFNGIFKKERRESSWISANAGLTDKQVRALVLDPKSPNILYAGTASGGVFKTTNGANRWKAINRGLLNTTVLSLAMTLTRPTTLYAGTVGGVFKIPNGGEMWLPTDRELPVTVTTLAIDPVKPSLVYAGSGGRLFKSTNAGEKWEEIARQVNHFGRGPISTEH